MERVRNICLLLLLAILLFTRLDAVRAANSNDDGDDNTGDGDDNDDQGGNNGHPCNALSLWQLGRVYNVGEKVLGPTLDRVFQCKQRNVCGLLKNEILPPGSPTTYLQAWKQLGPLCNLPGGVCPAVHFLLGTVYSVGARVSVDVNGTTHTFQCKVANVCGLADRQPLLGNLWKAAWTDLGICKLPGGVCPTAQFVLGKAYRVGATVQVTDTRGVVHTFTCTVANLCGLASHEPLLGDLWSKAWQDLGECRLQAGLCPAVSFVLNAPYAVGSLVFVTVDGVSQTLQCLLGNNQCGRVANQPLFGSTWQSAWRNLGNCVQMGGVCPAVEFVLNQVYTAGATVSVDVNGVPHTFRCNVGNLCGLADYQPLVGKLYRQAWKDLGMCQLAAGVCPVVDFVVNTTYALGNRIVSELDGVSHTVICKVPSLCGLANYQPLLGSLWRQAWLDLGECALRGGVCGTVGFVLNKAYALGATVSVDVNGERHTFACTALGNLCGLADHQPLLGALWRDAWRDLGECKLLGGVCPLVNFVLNTTYSVGSTVVEMLGGEAHTLACLNRNLCGLADYEPFVGSLWQQAWRDLGECEAKVGLCTGLEWALNTTYAVGQQVKILVDGALHSFVCNVVDVCGLVDRQPLVGALWQEAWTDLGLCNNPLTLKLCPVQQFVANTAYAVGATVRAVVDGDEVHTFVCMVPTLCSLATHQPLLGLLWRLAWADLGECVTTDVCPLVQWALNTVYQTGLTVRVAVNGGENHTFVCRVDNLCGLANYQPLVGSLWQQAWSDLGVCGNGTAAAAAGFDLAGGLREAKYHAEEARERTVGVAEAEAKETFLATDYETAMAETVDISASEKKVLFTPLVTKVTAGAAGALLGVVVAMGVLLARERRRRWHRLAEAEDSSRELRPTIVVI